MPKQVRNLYRFLIDRMPATIEIRRAKPSSAYEIDRFSYQSQYTSFDIEPGSQVMDIGSGGYPFPYATVLVDHFLEPTRHRSDLLVRAGKPLVLADVQTLPFRDKAFEYVYCSHVLEHVDNPLAACREIIRVGKRGYIEVPTFGKDALFAWAKGMHKWHIVAISENLCFFEYSERQMEGIGSPAWHEIILGRWSHPLKEAFYQNQDIFNVMFSWSTSFSVFVFRLDGTIEMLGAETVCDRASSHNDKR